MNRDRAAYQVSLPVYEGPLDLLLRLIERQEMDITQVSLASVTNQFLEHIAQMNERDADSLADFLVVAAKLLVIKSRVLLPQPKTAAPEEEDPGQGLVQQLLEYRTFREAARWLKQVEAQGLQSYVRLAAAPQVERTLDLSDMTLAGLVAAVRLALEIQPPEPSVNGAVAPLTVTISDQMELIGREVERTDSVSFLEILGRATSRLEIVVTLLALLELIKQRRVTVRQDRLFGDVLISAAHQLIPEPTGG